MKTGRNDPCHCGSGKKFKKCCNADSASPNITNKDHQWMSEHVLKDSDLSFYGSLYEEIPKLSYETFWKELRQISESYLRSGKKRTQIFHQIVDEKIDALIEKDKRDGYEPPFCHKGCCNCCNEVVFCTDEEAELINNYCKEKKIEIDYKKLERQLNHIEIDKNLDHTDLTTWNDQKEEDQSCVFLNLEERACTIWEERPFVCRVHLAEKTDQYCKPHNGVVNPNVHGINYLEWSYILTSIFTIHRNSIKKTMGQLLLNLKN
ncbi:MAG: SEC-C metal-binding domain-containing protein [bacterium]